MRQYSPRLRDDLGLTTEASNFLASTIASEVEALPLDAVRRIHDADVVGLERRLEELVAFERFMDYGSEMRAASGSFPPLARALVICQLYTVFVYLGDACFSRLRKAAASGSVLKRCCRYLTDHPVRGLRNAVAHATWRYADDYNGIIFYYFEDDQKTKRIEYTVGELELHFWDKLARVTAYSAFQTIDERG